ncbi:MAG TPA: hypothetical protein PKA10_06505 [Selenomonadales bacterium]|nr:hypothetical protein [Selenomonadales bacterium]
MVAFNTMDLVVRFCSRLQKHVTLEKHYTQKMGRPGSKSLLTVNCRNAGQCAESDCSLTGEGKPAIYIDAS